MERISEVGMSREAVRKVLKRFLHGSVAYPLIKVMREFQYVISDSSVFLKGG